jgi:hypothetical protein
MSTESYPGLVRNAQGHFVRGTAGGPGATSAKRQHELRKSLIEATDPAALKKAWDAMLEAAGNGDVNAAKLVFSYALGHPGVKLEIERYEEHRNVKVDLHAALLALGYTKLPSPLPAAPLPPLPAPPAEPLGEHAAVGGDSHGPNRSGKHGGCPGAGLRRSDIPF